MSQSQFPYQFPLGELYAESIKSFIVHCAKNNVSDFNLQGGDFIWVEQYGRQIQASEMKIPDSILKELIGHVWGPDIISKVVSGEDLDRALSVTGEEFGLERNETIRLRSNFIQANVGKTLTVCVTSRIIPDEVPTFKKISN